MRFTNGVVIRPGIKCHKDHPSIADNPKNPFVTAVVQHIS